MGDLGKFESAEKTFLGIPTDSESVSIRFDIYAFLTTSTGDASDDEVKVDIGSSTINLGLLNETDFGTTEDVVWWRSPIGSSRTNFNGIGGNDQVHHAAMMVPKALYADGSIKIKIYGSTGDDVTIGIDNVEIVAHYSCSCVPQKMVTSEDFESYSVDENGAEVRAAGWMHGKIAKDPNFTTFLGRYASTEAGLDQFPVHVFDVPPHADVITLEFEFYEIDDWTNADYVHFYVNGDKMDLGTINGSNLSASGISARGIEWTKTAGPRANMGFLDAVDQVHHVTLEIPKEVFATGQISLEFESHVSVDYSISSAGFDNVAVSANFTCTQTAATRSANIEVVPLLPTGCDVLETEFEPAQQCSMGSFGADKVNILESNDSTVKFTLTGHSFSDTTLNEVKVWFPHPERSNTDDWYDKCWSGAETSNEEGLFAQEFVAKCEDGWATVSVTGGEDESQGSQRFSQFVDVEEPLCTDQLERADFNPQKRCFWQFKVPCTSSCQRRNLVDTRVVTDQAAVPKSDCRTKSPVQDVHPVQVDKCVTTPSKDTVQIVSQDKESVTFSVSQKWKGCGSERGKLGWVATDYINVHGDLECVKKNDLSCGLAETYTAHCTDGIAVVDLYSFDEQEGLFGQTDGTDMVIPLACGASGTETKKCHFRYVLKCEPSLCEQAPVQIGSLKNKVEQRRRLGDQKKQSNK